MAAGSGWKDMMKPIGLKGMAIAEQRGQLTGALSAFAYKGASDLLYCWAEIPEADVSDDMVISSTNTFAESSGCRELWEDCARAPTVPSIDFRSRY